VDAYVIAVAATSSASDHEVASIILGWVINLFDWVMWRGFQASCGCIL